MQAHQDRINDMNAQGDSLVDSGQFDTANINERRSSINDRCDLFMYNTIKILIENSYISIHENIKSIHENSSPILGL